MNKRVVAAVAVLVLLCGGVAYWLLTAKPAIPPEPTAPSGPVSNAALQAQDPATFRQGIGISTVGHADREPGKLRAVVTWVNCKDGVTATVKGYKVHPDKPKETTPLRGREPHTSTEPTGRWQFDWDADDGMKSGDRVYFRLELRCGKYGTVQTFETPHSFVP